MIIHICGASGSGKTTLGGKLATKKIIVKDLDNLRDTYLRQGERTNTYKAFTKNFAIGYQKFIDDFIKKNRNKIIIFVGLNAFIVDEVYMFKGKLAKYPRMMFDLHADYKFYIKISSNTILKQLFNREYERHINWFCLWMKSRKDILFDNLINDEKIAKRDVCVALTRIMEFEKIKDNIKKWNNFYKENSYIFLSREEIYKKIKKLINIKN